MKRPLGAIGDERPSHSDVNGRFGTGEGLAAHVLLSVAPSPEMRSTFGRLRWVTYWRTNGGHPDSCGIVSHDHAPSARASRSFDAVSTMLPSTWQIFNAIRVSRVRSRRL